MVSLKLAMKKLSKQSLTMFNSIYVVLRDTFKSRNLTQRSELDGVYDAITSFEFVFNYIL
ncbi:zinc finger MYM-type protein 1-like [Gossypium australe]|uniref:Zinc finger MYM-type protein 1-like n=1 Tax=Gossypium australe TaxID=47621 RepID=A0A5B6WXT0_9ROSI|nr:zinc finger MYM-type protein 1-like [Gossypium australe]